MGVSEDAEAVLAAKFAVMRKVADERTWRVYLGSEALALGRGGIKPVALAAGVSETTVAAGVSEIESGELEELRPGRSRRPGAGRKKAEDTQPGLREALKGLVEAATRGDPVAEITWSSLLDLERQLAPLGFRCGKDAVARMLGEDGCSLQAMAKVLEGKQHPGRDDQFRHINAQIRQFRDAGDPVVSVDAKKKEQLGPYHRDGRAWRPKGDPVKVRDHDFPDPEAGKITPYGVYDIAANTGFVSVGTSHDTAAFAVSALRLWWQGEGSARYPAAGRLLVVCDAGGSNGHRCRLVERPAGPARGRDRAGDHGVPLPARHEQVEQDRAPAVLPHHPHLAGLAACDHDGRRRGGRHRRHHHLPGAEMHRRPRRRRLPRRGQGQRSADEGPGRTRHHPAWPGEWNYAIGPAPDGPEPAPPAAPAALALTWQHWPPWPASATWPPCWRPSRAPGPPPSLQRAGYLDRGAARRKASGGGPRTLPYDAIVTAAACRLRLRMPWRLLGELLGAHESTISLAARRVIPLLEEHGITNDSSTRMTTLSELRKHATAAGITLNITTTGHPAADHAKRRSPRTRHAQT